MYFFDAVSFKKLIAIQAEAGASVRETSTLAGVAHLVTHLSS